MQSNNEDVRISLLHDLFLLRNLPEEECPDLRRQECYLLNLFSEFLTRLDLLRVPHLNSVRQAFGVWASLQSAEGIEPQRLARAIHELSSGGHLPLFIRDQNAGLLISVDTLGSQPHEQTNGCNNGDKAYTEVLNTFVSETLTAVISTFPASLPTHDVSLPAAPPTFLYPTTSVRVLLSSILTSDFAGQICLLDAMQHNFTEVSEILN